ncbi:protein SEMI-ROLLED LEAF 2-like isoform X3 [Citrus sinensis]|uniref:protein SEMI-ROLLED LEAF 2-like isoform X3 n=1 Tax=Citrus sinensis TaxID=2711 RepID=UPI0022784969|nr:protein SEMI-ROLLED LEAF 2-like isoform X3 [Citrus sinensis]
MGVISRKMLPACESFCFFCPELKARSRHPVKWYKKLLAEIFSRSQDEQPNDQKISKLCEYAARNPLRIVKLKNWGRMGGHNCYVLLGFKLFHSMVWFMGEFSHIPTVFDNIKKVRLFQLYWKIMEFPFQMLLPREAN